MVALVLPREVELLYTHTKSSTVRLAAEGELPWQTTVCSHARGIDEIPLLGRSTTSAFVDDGGLGDGNNRATRNHGAVERPTIDLGTLSMPLFLD